MENVPLTNSGLAFFKHDSEKLLLRKFEALKWQKLKYISVLGPIAKVE